MAMSIGKAFLVVGIMLTVAEVLLGTTAGSLLRRYSSKLLQPRC